MKIIKKNINPIRHFCLNSKSLRFMILLVSQLVEKCFATPRLFFNATFCFGRSLFLSADVFPFVRHGKMNKIFCNFCHDFQIFMCWT